MEMGKKGRLSSRAAMLAGIVYEQGRYDEAMSLAEEADAVSAPDDMEPQIWLRGVRARCSPVGGDSTRASAKLARGGPRRSDRLAGTQGDGLGRPRGGACLAGRREEAAEAARRAEEYLERKGSLVMASRVRRFRAEIEAGPAER